MLRKAEYPLERKTLNLRKGTYEAYQIVSDRAGAAKLMREVLDDWLRENAPQVAQRILGQTP